MSQYLPYPICMSLDQNDKTIKLANAGLATVQNPLV